METITSSSNSGDYDDVSISDYDVTLSPEKLSIILKNWAVVQDISETVATIFYQNLFEINPDLRRLFLSDAADQRKKLMAMLNFLLNNIKMDELARILPLVKGLVSRHVLYGVELSHYDDVGAALIQTLEIGLKDDFDEAARNAWISLYATLMAVISQVHDDCVDNVLEKKDAPHSSQFLQSFYMPLEEKELIRSSWGTLMHVSKSIESSPLSDSRQVITGGAAMNIFFSLFKKPNLQVALGPDRYAKLCRDMTTFFSDLVEGFNGSPADCIEPTKKLNSLFRKVGILPFYGRQLSENLLATLRQLLNHQYNEYQVRAWTRLLSHLLKYFAIASNEGIQDALLATRSESSSSLISLGSSFIIRR